MWEDLPVASRLVISNGLVFVGAAFAVFSVVAYRKSKATESWPVVRGTIVSSVVQTDDDYSPRVTYRYESGGHEHQGTRISVLERSHASRSSAAAAASRYVPGQAIQVFVNPEDHTDAVLVPGSRGGYAAAFLAFGGAVCVLGIALLVATARQ